MIIMLFRSERKKSVIHHVEKVQFGSSAFTSDPRNDGQIAYNDTYFAEAKSFFGSYPNCQINVWRLENNTHVIKITPPKKHTDYVHTVLEFLPNNYLASGSSNIYIWNIQDGQNIRILKSNPDLYSNDTIYALRLLPDGRLASGESYGRIHIWGTNSKNFYKNMHGTHSGPALHCETLEVDRNDVMRDAPIGISEGFMMSSMMHIDIIEYIPDGRLLSTGGQVKGDQIFFVNDWNVIRIWDLYSKRCISVLKGGYGFLWTLKALSKDRFVSQECSGGTISPILCVWDINKKTKISTLQFGTNEHPHILSDGTLVTVEKKSESEYIHHIWDISNISLLASKRHVMSFALPNINYFIKLLNNRLLSTTNLEIWDLNPRIELVGQPQISISDPQKSVATLKTVDTETVIAEDNSHTLSESKFEFQKINTFKKHITELELFDDEADNVTLTPTRPIYGSLSSSAIQPQPYSSRIVGSDRQNTDTTATMLHTNRDEQSLFHEQSYGSYRSSDKKNHHTITPFATNFFREPTFAPSVKAILSNSTGDINQGITALIGLPSGELASGHSDGMIQIWNTTNQTLKRLNNRVLRRSSTGGGHYVTLTVLPTGELVSRCASDNITQIWNTATGQCLRSFADDATGALNSLLALATGELVSGYHDGLIRIWNTTTGECIQLLTEHSHSTAPHHIPALAMLPTGELVSGSYDQTIKIWNTTTGECIKTLTGHTEYVVALTVLPTGELASGSNDNTIRIWNTATGVCIRVLRGHTASIMHQQLMALPTGELVSMGWDHTIRLWDIGTGNCLWQTGNGPFSDCMAPTVLPTGELVIAHTESNNVNVYSQHPYRYKIQLWDFGLPRTFSNEVAAEISTPKMVSISSVSQSLTTARLQPAQTLPMQNEYNLLALMGDRYDSTEGTGASHPQSQSNRATSSSEFKQEVGFLSETEDFSISREDFETLTKQLEKAEKRCAISLEMLDEKIKACEQQLMPSAFSSEDIEAWQAHLAKYRKKEALLLERQTILSNPTWETYYRAIQIHFSGLMIASLGIGTGYVQVSNSKKAKAFKYVASAIGFAFPTHHVSVVTSAASDVVNFFDARARKDFLKKINVFGNTQTEAEILGEKVARLLLRARVHAGDDISSEQADRDAEALIKAILQTTVPIVRNKSTAHILIKMIFGYAPYCASLPLHVVSTKPACSSKLTQSYMHPPIEAENSTTSERFEAGFCELRDKLHDIQEKTKDTPSQASVAELAQQMQIMQKTVSRLQVSDRLVDSVEIVPFSDGSQVQAQLLVKRHGSARNETYQEQIDQKERQIALVEEQMQVMAQEIARLNEHVVTIVQQSSMAEDEKRGLMDDVNSFNGVSERIQRRVPQQRLEETLTKCSLFGQPASLASVAQTQEGGAEATKKKAAKKALDPKNTIRTCIKSALLNATTEYIRFCDAQKGITSHGGSVSRMDCQNLNLVANQALSTQLFYLIQRFDSHTSSSKMGTYSLDTFIINVLIRKLSQLPLLQTKMSAINLLASDKSAIKIPQPLFGIYSNSEVAENCFRREQIRRLLIAIQQEFIADCSATKAASLFV